MKSCLSIFSVFLLCIYGVLADLEIKSPTEGKSYSASGGTVSIPASWKESSDSTDELSLDNASKLYIKICAGEGINGDFSCFDYLYNGDYITSKSKTLTLETTDVPSGNYFLQFTVVFEDGSYTIHYSGRFKLTGMSGSLKSISASSIPDVSATGDVPAAQSSPKSTGINSASFSIPYTKQTGSTRYAPMQMQPGTTITAKSWSRRHPTSAVTYFSTYMKNPSVYSTITPGWSYTCPSHANWASAAPYPTYYYNPSQRVKKAYLTTAAKKKRWIE